jgi:hypothetical protein
MLLGKRFKWFSERFDSLQSQEMLRRKHFAGTAGPRRCQPVPGSRR